MEIKKEEVGEENQPPDTGAFLLILSWAVPLQHIIYKEVEEHKQMLLKFSMPVYLLLRKYFAYS